MHTHDTRLRTPDGAVYYPAVYVTCGPKAHALYDTDAVGSVEVKSPSTEVYDDKGKSPAYMKLPSLQGCLLTDPESRAIEVRTPVELGWDVRRYVDGAVVQVGPAELDVTKLFDQLEELDPSTGDGLRGSDTV